MTSDAWIARDKDQAFQNGFVFSNPSTTLVSRSISSRGGRFAPPLPFSRSLWRLPSLGLTNQSDAIINKINKNYLI